ncbi:MAG: hypothetical protein A2W01_12365 [Candidatus Solincola sediminis]|nr:MAG: hypothetical protein A2W01_12365 [Candidatus Solincola sediminis]
MAYNSGLTPNERVVDVGEQEHSEWTGKRGRIGGLLLGNRLLRWGEELAFGRSISAVLKEVASLINGDETILDVGSGSGGLSIPLAKRLSSGQVICLDLSDEMLARLESRAQKAGLERRIKIVRAPASQTGLEADSVDFAVSNNVFHELDKPKQTLAEQLKVLKTGGHLIISDFRPTRLVSLMEKSHRPYEAEEIESLLNQAGFKNIEIRPNRHRFLAYARK